MPCRRMAGRNTDYPEDFTRACARVNEHPGGMHFPLPRRAGTREVRGEISRDLCPSLGGLTCCSTS